MPTDPRAAISLDQPPPAASKLGSTQGPSPNMFPQSPSPSSAAGPQMAMQAAMQIEQLLQVLSASLPGFAPIAEQLVSVLRQGVMAGVQTMAQGNIGTGAPPLGAGATTSPTGQGAGTPPPMGGAGAPTAA